MTGSPSAGAAAGRPEKNSASRTSWLDPHELGPSQIAPFEKQLLEAIEAEAENPSFENRPDSVSDPRSRRETVDPGTNHRQIELIAKRSFISDMKPPVRKAVICDPRTLSGRERLFGGRMMTQH